jgi:hypothetical protein
MALPTRHIVVLMCSVIDRRMPFQVDNELLTDDELWQLVCALPSSFRQYISAQPDSERMRRVTARKAAAKTLGQQMVIAPPAPRPVYTATDAG